MWIKNDSPSSTAHPEHGAFHWEGGDSVDVPDAFANELLAIQDSGFYLDAEKWAKRVEAEVKAEAEKAVAAAKSVAKDIESRARRARKAVTEPAPEAAAGAEKVTEPEPEPEAEEADTAGAPKA